MQSDLKLAADELQKMWTEIMYSYLPTPEEMENIELRPLHFSSRRRLNIILELKRFLIWASLTGEKFLSSMN